MVSSRNPAISCRPAGQFEKGVHSLWHLGSFKQQRGVKGTTFTSSAMQNLPKPVQTTSLRKENGGQDINVDLIRRGLGTGWGSALKSSTIPSDVPRSDHEKSMSSLPHNVTLLVNHSDSRLAESSSSSDAKSEASCHQVSNSNITASFRNGDENGINKHSTRLEPIGQSRENFPESFYKHEDVSFDNKLCVEPKKLKEPILHLDSEYSATNQVNDKKQLMNNTNEGNMVSDDCSHNGRKVVAYSQVVESEPQVQSECYTREREQRIQEPLDSSLTQRKGGCRPLGLSRSSCSKANDENVAPMKILIRETSNINIKPRIMNCSHTVEQFQKRTIDHQVPANNFIEGNRIALQLVDFENKSDNRSEGEALTPLEQQKNVLHHVLLVREEKEKNKPIGIATVRNCETRQKNRTKLKLKREMRWSNTMAREGSLPQEKNAMVEDARKPGDNTRETSKLEQKKKKTNGEDLASAQYNLTVPETKAAISITPLSYLGDRGKAEHEIEVSLLREGSLKSIKACKSEKECSCMPDWSPSVAIFSFQIESIWNATCRTGEYLRSPDITASIQDESLRQDRNGISYFQSPGFFITGEEGQASHGVDDASSIVNNDQYSYSRQLKSCHRKFMHSNSNNKRKSLSVRRFKKK